MRHGDTGVPLRAVVLPTPLAAPPAFIEGIPSLHLLVGEMLFESAITRLAVAAEQALVRSRQGEVTPFAQVLYTETFELLKTFALLQRVETARPEYRVTAVAGREIRAKALVVF